MTDKRKFISTLKQVAVNTTQRLLTKRAVLIKQGQLYSLGNKKPTKPMIAIIGREHYKVSEKAYPIAKKRAVLNVARREFASDGAQQFHVSKLDAGKRLVRVVTIAAPTLQLLPESVKFVVPEQDVVLGEQHQQAVEYQLNEKCYWFAYKGSDIVGAESGGLIRTQDAFEMSIGGVGTREWRSMSMSDYQRHLSDQLIKINWLNIASYSLSSGRSFDVKRWIPVASAAGIIFVVYFVIVQAWLVNSNADLKTRALQLSEQAATVFEQQDQLEALNQKARELQAIVSQQRLDPRIWLVLSPIVTSDAEVYRLTFSERTGFIAEGESANATDTLAQIRGHRLVADAGFNTPTVETQGVERFSINLSLRKADDNSYRTVSDMSLLDSPQDDKQDSTASNEQEKPTQPEAGRNTSPKTPGGGSVDKDKVKVGTETYDWSELPPSVRKQLREEQKRKESNTDGGNNDN